MALGPRYRQGFVAGQHPAVRRADGALVVAVRGGAESNDDICVAFGLHGQGPGSILVGGVFVEAFRSGDAAAREIQRVVVDAG